MVRQVPAIPNHRSGGVLSSTVLLKEDGGRFAIAHSLVQTSCGTELTLFSGSSLVIPHHVQHIHDPQIEALPTMRGQDQAQIPSGNQTWQCGNEKSWIKMDNFCTWGNHRSSSENFPTNRGADYQKILLHTWLKKSSEILPATCLTFSLAFYLALCLLSYPAFDLPQNWQGCHVGIGPSASQRAGELAIEWSYT